MRPRWKIRDMMLLVLFCGFALASPRALEAVEAARYQVLRGAFLASLGTATTVAFLDRPTRRPVLIGYAVFGWIYLIFGMGAPWDFEIKTIYDANRIAAESVVAMLFGAMSGVASSLLFRGRPETARERHAAVPLGSGETRSLRTDVSGGRADRAAPTTDDNAD